MQRAFSCTYSNRAAVARTAAFVISVMALFAVTACTDAPVVRQPDKPLSSDLLSAPNYVLSVPLSGGETMEATAEHYGGDILVWKEGDYALLGLAAAPVYGEPGYALEGEPNDAQFIAGARAATNLKGESGVWGSGRSTLWAGGRSTLWAGGRSTLWAGGVFLWMPENSDLWQQINLLEAHGLAKRLGVGIKVAIIDTGVDLEHPALRESLAPATEWWDFVDNDAVPQEEGELGAGYGHGSNVAGIVRQIAPRATILPIRVLSPDGEGKVADLAAAIDWAVEMGADVINLSMGSDHKMSTVDKALKRAAQEGVFVLSSVGNENINEVTYPAREANRGNPVQTLHMVSVTSLAVDGVKSDFANYSKRVELAAPGEKVFGPAPRERLGAWSGTSMAAPIASGAVALALAEDLDVARHDLTPLLLASSSKDIYDIDGNIDYARKAELGSGRIDVYNFLKQVTGDAPIEEVLPLATGGGTE